LSLLNFAASTIALLQKYRISVYKVERAISSWGGIKFVLRSVALTRFIYGAGRVGRPAGGRIPLTSFLSRATFHSNANFPAAASIF